MRYHFGMVQIFIGIRQATPKYLAEPITMTTYDELMSATVPPKEHVFEQAIVKKLRRYPIKSQRK